LRRRKSVGPGHSVQLLFSDFFRASPYCTARTKGGEKCPLQSAPCRTFAACVRTENGQWRRGIASNTAYCLVVGRPKKSCTLIIKSRQFLCTRTQPVINEGAS
jgi:hypothetical protein